jgi:Protein of unknown function (DUF2510)
MVERPELTRESIAWAMAKAQRDDPHFFARKAAESEAERRRIIDEVARTAGPHADVDYLTKRELYRAGLISASELHATGSRELLPRGWYQHYVDVIAAYCPTRVFSLEEAGTDAADYYDRGYRWMAVFSDRTGPRGDRTFIDVRSFAAAAMTENKALTEQDALHIITRMGYQLADLPDDVFLTPPPASAPQPGPGWYPDPASRFQHRWWNGQHWTHTVAAHGQTYSDPV